MWTKRKSLFSPNSNKKPTLKLDISLKIGKIPTFKFESLEEDTKLKNWISSYENFIIIKISKNTS
ncbi:hypothetical protein HVMH_1273 [Hydrogenovibrio marinus]|nr:hypothetical protein HVMH_1273 [Hydrogenovibrio marinus]